ncbi:MAG: TetR/AcrR family transcriptional regulator [Mycolicibacterium cosmeticum]|nr:TetR/AcrR family transcriptional regulator [Mycolicibacterium cosmeticum]
MSERVEDGPPRRTRGRPRLTIDHEDVADAVAELYAEGGYEAVSIVETADRLGVSRATLYRSVPTKEELVAILFEQCTGALTESTTAAMAGAAGPAAQLIAMIRVQADAAVRMRSYIDLIVGGPGLPPDVYSRWLSWSREMEKMWVGVVGANMADGHLDEGNPAVTARLILGMIVSVSRWSRPKEQTGPEEIAQAVIQLLRLSDEAPGVLR